MMPLFNPILAPPPAEQLAAQAIVADGNALLALLTTRYGNAYNRLWANPAATPDKIVSALGTQAQAIFTHSATLAAFINSFGQAQVPAAPPAGWTVTFNADGSAAASYTAPAS
jgi:hypothetical protein